MKLLQLMFTGLAVAAVSVQGRKEKTPTSTGTCEPLTLPLCKDLPYTQTLMPNALGHKTQQEAGREVSELSPLVELGCSTALKPFLCSVYAPQCESGKAQAPCKTTCEAARRGCEPVMKEFAVLWPEALNCDKFSLLTCDDDNAEGITTSTPQQSIKMSDLPSILNSKAAAERSEVLSTLTCRYLFLYSDKDGSDDLNTAEFEALKTYLGNLSNLFAGRWRSATRFAQVLNTLGLHLDQKTTGTMIKAHGIGQGTTYDEFVSIIIRLHLMQERFNAKILSGLPCDCKIAGFTFDELILTSVL
ncbi:frizzled-5-like [Engraulis encrasicolus]|uniref:frizzled-5-like n=1 Tax=Engraulis encrasicolus TaxID=184585 RepID=UPI002FD52050